MPDTTDDNAGTPPGETPAEVPTMAQAYVTPPSPPRAPSGLRKHWPLIVGAVAAAILLVLAGTALGAAIGGHGIWGDHHGLRQGESWRGNDGRGGQMMGPGGPMNGQGGNWAPGSNGTCPRGYDDGTGGYGPGYGQPGAQPAPGSSATPEAAPSQSTAP